jgi:hypothetical protein
MGGKITQPFYTLVFNENGSAIQSNEYNGVPLGLSEGEVQCTKAQHDDRHSYVLRNGQIIFHPDASVYAVGAKLKREFREKCRNRILANFESLALEVRNEYGCTMEDQTNLARMVLIGEAAEISCLKDGVWERRKHSPLQLRTLLSDMNTHIEVQRRRLAHLLVVIDQSTKRAQLDMLRWD